MNLPYRIKLETVLDSLLASCDQSGASSKRQATSSASKKTPTKSSTVSDSKSPASQKAKRKRSPSPPAAATRRRRCTLCPTKRVRKTKTQYSKCSKYVCGEHSSFTCTVCNSN
ncbi:PiggyBac transposable element-derived 4-like protein [Plakobranchus ocellatus]|uniref:PiggyBac transposable element-derived 4-like protein n=1 Tax=Plakobranchus ocellatus TaxID=259542 RepID=A0AAV4CML1_9GAST|nr:PiggyBac transposable element-derived 4-like protein [Plakobranchus ocellatus]